MDHAKKPCPLLKHMCGDLGKLVDFVSMMAVHPELTGAILDIGLQCHLSIRPSCLRSTVSISWQDAVVSCELEESAVSMDSREVAETVFGKGFSLQNIGH